MHLVLVGPAHPVGRVICLVILILKLPARGLDEVPDEKSGEEQSSEKHRGVSAGEILGIAAQGAEVTLAHVIGHALKMVCGAMGEPRDVRILFLQRAGSVIDRKSTRLNSSHLGISYAVFCL